MPLKWHKQLIADVLYESAGVFDVTGNGRPDIVSGAYWYEGPDFTKKRRVRDLQPIGEYFNDFSTIPMDVNGDGRVDFVTGGWWDPKLLWIENPGPAADGEWPEWPVHEITELGNIETTRAWDVDDDGHDELVPNLPGEALHILKLKTDGDGKGTGAFDKHLIHDGPQGHGLGFGDITGNGKGDFVLSNGWLEAPRGNPLKEKWVFHDDFEAGFGASVPILVVDVNRDGLNDLIVGAAHGYGLDWWEQTRTKAGRIRWKRHAIDPFNAGFHDMMWVDLDGDGEHELLTGKRYRAHNDNDPGAFDDYGIYYYKWNGDSFTKEVIDYGPPRVTTGLGIHFAVADTNGDGRLDIIAPGKDGLYLFRNLGT